ncbi:hypothetical protein tb265_24900 [Gemmatimonadetes bacterium T265]|nr:hypothetical protein tb265_24900 [Gemmatimonadetes bacterium T265]
MTVGATAAPADQPALGKPTVDALGERAFDEGPVQVLIVDDEPLARTGLRLLLGAHPWASVVGEAEDGDAAVRAIDAARPDVVLLDAQLPECDGFAVLRRLAAHDVPVPHVVFVTAYDAHALRAFEADALDYVVKPVAEARFAAAMARAHARVRAQREVRALRAAAATGEAAGATLGTSFDAEPARRLVVPGVAGDVLLDLGAVRWIQADDYYAAVHAGGRRHLVRESLTSLARRLDPAAFVRVHRSAIVNLAHVRQVRARERGGVVVLDDGTRIPVSRRRCEAVARAVRQFAR